MGVYAGTPYLVSDNERSGTQQSGAGLAREELTAGRFVTVSENKRVPADRSLVCAIWEVIGHNETHVLLRLHSPPRSVEPMFPTYVVPLSMNTISIEPMIWQQRSKRHRNGPAHPLFGYVTAKDSARIRAYTRAEQVAPICASSAPFHGNFERLARSRVDGKAHTS